jgi:pimeloyl-ACP methyl ester carboxylesterase
MPARTHLILLPGLLCNEALWTHQIAFLGDEAECSVADTTRHDSIEAIARDVLDTAPATFALAGLSMGGYVALEIMRLAPERVTRLCLLDTSARPDPEEQKQRRKLLISMSQAGKFKGVTPRLLPMLISPARLGDKSVTDVIMAMAETMGRDVFVRQQTAILNREDSRPYLSSIRCRTQVICGTEDAITPPATAEELAAGIPGSRIALIEKCGHLSTLEQPDRVNQLMKDWLAAT